MANIYKNSKKDLTTNTVTTLYTVPSSSRGYATCYGNW